MKLFVSPALVALLSLPLTACLSQPDRPDQGPYGTRLEAMESSSDDAAHYSNRDPYHEQARRPNAPRQAQRDSYNHDVETFHITIGAGQLRDDVYWQGLDEPWFFGMDYASSPQAGGLGAEVGFQLWGDSTILDEELSAAELFAGLRYTANAGRRGPHPYLGVGGTLIGAKLERPGYDENEGSIGLYGHAGLTMPMGNHMEIGLDFRMVRGTEADFPGGSKSDFDYNRLALVLGWSF
ncbi:MAG: hypothetical protein ACI9X4_000423 [Glaciecola sp.]|jgi:hypothetical protein